MILRYLNDKILCINSLSVEDYDGYMIASLFQDCQVVAYYSIKSPRYPKDYPGNMDCVYEIPILHYKALTFTFQDFHLEESSFW